MFSKKHYLALVILSGIVTFSIMIILKSETSPFWVIHQVGLYCSMLVNASLLYGLSRCNICRRRFNSLPPDLPNTIEIKINTSIAERVREDTLKEILELLPGVLNLEYLTVVLEKKIANCEKKERI